MMSHRNLLQPLSPCLPLVSSSNARQTWPAPCLASGFCSWLPSFFPPSLPQRRMTESSIPRKVMFGPGKEAPGWGILPLSG